MTQDIVIDCETIAPVPAQAAAGKTKARRPAQKPFEWLSDLNHQVRGETALWVAVITQAMMDALSNSKNAETRYHKHEATRWLTGNSRNFITVCHFAGLDPRLYPAQGQARPGRAAALARRGGKRQALPGTQSLSKTPEIPGNTQA